MSNSSPNSFPKQKTALNLALVGLRNRLAGSLADNDLGEHSAALWMWNDLVILILCHGMFVSRSACPQS